jgi:hypothetical protein
MTFDLEAECAIEKQNEIVPIRVKSALESVSVEDAKYWMSEAKKGVEKVAEIVGEDDDIVIGLNKKIDKGQELLNRKYRAY